MILVLRLEKFFISSTLWLRIMINASLPTHLAQSSSTSSLGTWVMRLGMHFSPPLQIPSPIPGVTLLLPIGQAWEGSLCISWPNLKQDLWILSGIFMLSVPPWNYLLIPFSKQGSRLKLLFPSPAERLCGRNANVVMQGLKGLLLGRWACLSQHGSPPA